MDEARAVLARLDRIEALEREGTPAHVLLDEVRVLLAEAERWARTEHGELGAAFTALEQCRRALEEPAKTTGTQAGLW